MATVAVAAALLVIIADRAFGPAAVPGGQGDQLRAVASP
jgi:hypothetical protein